MDTFLSSESQQSPFLALPLELRYQIYSYLPVKLDYAIPISEHPAFLDTGVPRSERPLYQCMQLLLVNQQIYEEVGYLFFTKNTFIVGNGDITGVHWSIQCPTLSAFKIFVNQVPYHHLSLIRDLHFNVMVRNMKGGYHARRRDTMGLGSCKDVSALFCITRGIASNFTGLEKLTVGIGTKDMTWDMRYEVNLPRVDIASDERSIALSIHDIWSSLSSIVINVGLCDLYDRDNVFGELGNINASILDDMGQRLKICRTRGFYDFHDTEDYDETWDDWGLDTDSPLSSLDD